jgi:hypothetical protein
VKWLKQIELLERDRPGFWERTSAYHNVADPILEQRYDSQPLTASAFRECVARRDFRDAFAIMDPQFKELRGAALAHARFDHAVIKACDFVGVDMRAAVCRSANLTRSRFLDADLREADLSGCDLEGADFRGANLTGADMRGASLTATRFFSRQRPTVITGLRLLRADLDNDGLDEEDRRFLCDPNEGAVVVAEP